MPGKAKMTIAHYVNNLKECFSNYQSAGMGGGGQSEIKGKISIF